ncbi:MAG: hypothetical protein LBG14_03875 [Treponema sp.]|jgi:hypothetical protein|nr:hypothetical protein [Treponema sp.]
MIKYRTALEGLNRHKRRVFDHFYHALPRFLAAIPIGAPVEKTCGSPYGPELGWRGSADPPVTLAVVYYAAGSAAALEGPPVEPGDYLARISFGGNANYPGASKDVAFSISYLISIASP